MSDEPKVGKIEETTTEVVEVEPVAVETEVVAVKTLADEERRDFAKALGEVVLGAAMSEKGGSFGTMREIMAAMRASAVFVGDSSNAFLREIVSGADSSDQNDAESEASDTSLTGEQAVENGIAAAKRTHDQLLAQGQTDDADAWAQLLLTAANAAVEATKTGGFLGFGGEKVTASEQAYMQRLADTLGYKKEKN